jgi:hypothetical protein
MGRGYIRSVNSDVLNRPARHTLLKQHESVLDAPVARVLAALTIAVDPGAQSSFAVDESVGLIVVQGGWWYRAEYTVRPDESGSRVTFSLLNVATPAHWAGPITGRDAIRSSARDFGDVIDRVRAAV